ncbi:MAG: glycosyltransferase [Candidatus Omnitrophica bacterium]|nr:glycosyltransferase [Candidatus Omnitrophota bacterium]
MLKRRKNRNLPKISIVIPSFNKKDYIGETLQSIVDQKYPNLEVLIQDGGSTDGTLDIIKEYTKKHPKIFYWESKKDKGQVDAINKGLKKVSGDIATYINADDVYEKEALLKVGEYFANNPKTLWLAGKGRVINSEGKEISKIVTFYKNTLLAINHYSLLLIVNYLMQPSVFLSEDVYKKYGPFTGTKNYVMEYDLWLKIAAKQVPSVLADTLSSFRIAGDNISSTQFNSLLVTDLNLVKKYTKNPIILLLHKINNLGRIVNILLMKRG